MYRVILKTNNLNVKCYYVVWKHRWCWSALFDPRKMKENWYSSPACLLMATHWQSDTFRLLPSIMTWRAYDFYCKVLEYTCAISVNNQLNYLFIRLVSIHCRNRVGQALFIVYLDWLRQQTKHMVHLAYDLVGLNTCVFAT